MSKPSADGRLPILVETEDGAKRRPFRTELHKLIAQLGGEGDHFAVAEHVPATDQVYLQTWKDEGEPYLVECRDGGEERHFSCWIRDARQVAAVFEDWAREGDAWRREHEWEPMSFQLPEVPAETRQFAEEVAETLIKGGFHTYEEVAKEVADCVLAEAQASDMVTEGTARRQARVLIERPWEERLVEQAEWPETTGPDRLQAAFDALEARNIMVRQDFLCCMTCADAEAMEEAEGRSPATEGFVFFHRQDTERAVAGQGLLLAYGVPSGSPIDQTTVGRRTTVALAEAGLSYEWDGSSTTRIHVTPLEWRKRLPRKVSDPSPAPREG